MCSSSRTYSLYLLFFCNVIVIESLQPLVATEPSVLRFNVLLINVLSELKKQTHFTYQDEMYHSELEVFRHMKQ